MGLLENFFSALTSFDVKRVITVKSEEDVKNHSSNATPIYEYFRNQPNGENVLDFNSLKGIEDLGDQIRVLAGTKWKDVIKYKPETWSVLNFSVGGSVYFGDEGFGFNEFGELSKRVEVEAYLNGEKYKGKYRGGIIYAVYIKKESKSLQIRRISGDTRFIISKARSLLSYSPLPFRDISIIIQGGEATLTLAYPEIREVLVKRFLEGFEIGDIPTFELKDYKYMYVGKTTLEKLDEKELEKANMAYITLRNAELYYVILSDVELNLRRTNLNFNGCVACGRCVDVCPHSFQRDSILFSPLGFYVLSTRNEETPVSNCHLCGLCENVCVAKLDIVSALKSRATLKSISPTVNLYIPQRKSIVITAISEPFVQEIFKLIKFFSLKGLKVGVITLQDPLDKLVKGEIDKEKAKKLLDGVDEIITLTPEEAHYLQALKTIKIIEITFAYTLLRGVLDELMKVKKVHYPCFYKGNSYNGCSYEMLNLVNEEGYGSIFPKADVTLCPLAAKKLGINSYVDLLGVVVDTTVTDKIYEDIVKSVSSINSIIDDLSWYREIDEKLFSTTVDSAIISSLEDKDYFDLLLFYINMNKYTFENELKDRINRVLQNLLFGSDQKY